MHCFIPAFSQRTHPLAKLLQKSVAFKWEEEQDLAFESLKNQISEKSMAFHPNFTEPLYLASDVCKDFFASILYQVQVFTKDSMKKHDNQIRLPPRGKGTPPPLDLTKLTLSKKESDEVLIFISSST